jgi:hypothetical protein
MKKPSNKSLDRFIWKEGDFEIIKEKLSKRSAIPTIVDKNNEMNYEEIIAYHEAGHIVVFRYYRIPICGAHIIPDYEKGLAGLTSLKTSSVLNNIQNTTEKKKREYVTGILTGDEAVKIIGKDPHVVFEEDSDEVVFFEEDDEGKILIFICDYMNDDNGNPCSIWIGTGMEITEEGCRLIEKLKKDAHDILIEKWDKVELLAKTLLVSKKLSKKEIYEIYRS